MTTTTPPTGLPTTPAAPRNDWRSYATCRETDPDLFVPTGMGGQVSTAVKQAKKICGGCPVRSECLDWALATGQRNGVWGGLSEGELRAQAEKCPSHEEIALRNMPYIQERLAARASVRQVAAELGIGHWGVRRALETVAGQTETAEEGP